MSGDEYLAWWRRRMRAERRSATTYAEDGPDSRGWYSHSHATLFVLIF
jgi:hypothetical protein